MLYFRKVVLISSFLALIPAILAAQNCDRPEQGMPPTQEIDECQRAEASKATINANHAVRLDLNFSDTQDFKDATRGLIIPLDTDPIMTNGVEVWNLSGYDFEFPVDPPPPSVENPVVPEGYPDAPDSVNPSLWRQEVLNTIHGVFEVYPEKIYQVRAQDMSNMTAIRGDNGWIIIDPLTVVETAQAALQKLKKAVNDDVFLISAIIFTHSHADHFGGVRGLFESDDAFKNFTEVYVPEGFLEEVVSENVIAGNAMVRRATYMYGPLVPKHVKGQVGSGLGKILPGGTSTLTAPDEQNREYNISGPGDVVTKYDSEAQDKDFESIDGVRIWFQNVPGSEAPAEMMFYFPEWKALCASEDVTGTLHNVLTLRGAKVRDPLIWAKYLHQTLKLFPDARVMFASHHWPTWNYEVGNETNPSLDQNNVADKIAKQRDLYRFLHDQTVRLFNQGYTIQEVGELIKLPDTLRQEWYNRGYYGTVNHNVKAIYQRYIGWFDGNPASLHQLPPAQAGAKYIEYMGKSGDAIDLKRIVDMAEMDYEKGDNSDATSDEYRWVAMVLSHVVAGAPLLMASDELPATASVEVDRAKGILANTYDQLAYQAESGPWRNFYLQGAAELRNGVPNGLPALSLFSESTVEKMTMEMIFDYLAIHLKGDEAEEKDYIFNISLDDDREAVGTDDSILYVKHSVINYDIGAQADNPTALLEMSRATLNGLVLGEDVVSEIAITGDTAAANDFFGLLDKFNFWFNIATPNDPPSAN